MGKLSDYGYDYQVKMLSALLKDQTYAAQLFDLYEHPFVQDQALSFLFQSYFTYYTQYKNIPPLEYFKVQIQSQQSESFQTQILSHLKKAWSNLDSVDLQYIKDSSIEACKINDMKKTLLQCTDLINKGDLNSVKQAIDKSLAKGQADSIGYDYNNDVASRMHIEEQVRVPTPWEEINNITNGGLPVGNLGIIIAPTGVGKSWLLAQITGFSAKMGYNVFHYTLELEDTYVGLRIDTIMYGIPTVNLPLHEQKITKASKELEGNVRIFRYPTRRLSIVGIEAHLDKMALLGHKPDLIVIDYADILKIPQTFKRDDLAIQGLYEELRGIAGDRQVPIWTASQTNRSGASADIVEGTDVSDSYGKIMTADLVLTISRHNDDVMNNRARMFVDKSRLGEDKIAFPMEYSTINGTFKVLPRIKDQISQGKTKVTQQKKYLKNIYDQINGSGSAEGLFD